MIKVRFLFLLLIAGVLFLSCSSFEKASYSRYYDSSAGEMEVEAPSPRAAGSTAKRAMEPPAALAAVAEQPEQEAKGTERKRVYSGFASLVVDSVEQTRKRIMETVLQEGGYVESVKERIVILRVPAEKFHSLFQEFLSLGSVRSSSIETLDITEAFTDTEARLNLAKKTRERLYTLLEKTEDLNERLAILREIRRLTEEIERLSLSIESMEKQIAFSRIQIELIPRLSEEVSLREAIPFPWIARLNPLYTSLNQLKGKIQITLPETYAVFSQETYFQAETPDGVRVRIGSISNSPTGDAEFWQKALIYHLGSLYRTAEIKEIPASKEELLCTLFTSKDPKPYYYLVGVAVKGDYLYVVEAFFLEEEHKEKYLAGLLLALADLEIRR